MNYRVVATVVLLNPEGKVLIMLRGPHRKVHPNLWGLPGGGVIGTENLEETAIRETFEETGLRLNAVKKGPTLKVKVPGAIHQVNCFFGKTNSSKVTLNSEHSEYRWVFPSETLNYQFGIPNKDVKRVLEEFGLL